MSSILNATAFFSLLLLTVTPAFAQTPAARPATHAAPAAATAAPSPAGAIVRTAVYLTVKDVAATKALLTTGLGGKAGTAGSLDTVTFPGLVVLIAKGTPAGGTSGSTVSAITLDVKDLKAVVATLKAAKAKLVTRTETNLLYPVVDDIATLPDQQTISAVVQTTDEVNIRLVENKQAAAPVVFRNLHFSPAAIDDTMAWYARAFGAREGDRGFGFQSLDVGTHAGLLRFTLANDKVTGTEGRSLGRIGFEVRGAALLARKLQGLGAKVVKPLGKAESGATSVVLSDPFGTLIELTEGLKP